MKRSIVQDERAQGVVEFALIVSVLMLLFVGTVDYARFLYYNTAVTNAARVGAELASNHCVNETICADPNTASTTVTADNYVLWASYCEASPYVALTPSFSSCDNSGKLASWSPAATSGTNCGNDICVSPSTRSQGTKVSVTVGYKFHAIAFLLDWVFTEHQCWTAAGGGASDDNVAQNHHTLCATSTGKVS
jgi:Flp pilus assembly protein TadG